MASKAGAFSGARQQATTVPFVLCSRLFTNWRPIPLFPPVIQKTLLLAAFLLVASDDLTVKSRSSKTAVPFDDGGDGAVKPPPDTVERTVERE